MFVATDLWLAVHLITTRNWRQGWRWGMASWAFRTTISVWSLFILSMFAVIQESISRTKSSIANYARSAEDDSKVRYNSLSYRCLIISPNGHHKDITLGNTVMKLTNGWHANVYDLHSSMVAIRQIWSQPLECIVNDPKRCERRRKRIWWSTVSNAAEWSNRSSITQELLSMARSQYHPELQSV